MVKRYRYKLVFLALLFIKINLIAQQDAIRIGLVTEYSENFNARTYSGGLGVEIPVTKQGNLALNYKFLLGGSSDKSLYVHSTLGGAAGSWLLANSNSKSDLSRALGIFLCFIPDGITFYPDPQSKFSPGFYVNPISSDYWTRKSYGYEEFKVSGEIGGKIYLVKHDKILIQAHVGLKYLYGNKSIEPLFVHTGVGVFLRMPKSVTFYEN